MMSTPGYQRWYDADLHLSDMVRLLESMTTDSQRLFAYLLCGLSEQIIQDKSRTYFMMQLSLGKIAGLAKSKLRRRWYDRDPVMHKAFNMLYSLEDADKNAIALQLCEATRLVWDYEQCCLKASRRPQGNVVEKILTIALKEGVPQAQAYVELACCA